MNKSALDKDCREHGCAKIWLDPKLHHFDDCFGGKIRMGDVDGALERNGWVVLVEWKKGPLQENFYKKFAAQIRLAKGFTANSKRQAFVFVVGDPAAMDVEAFRIIYDGDWLRDWQHTGIDGFRGWLKTWFMVADGARPSNDVA